MKHWVVAYDRKTEKFVDGISVPVWLERQACMTAGVDRAAPGESPLSDGQVIALAIMLDFTFDFSRFVYHFDTIPAP